MTVEEYEWILSLDLDGEQDAHRLLEAARPEDSPGHGLFDWDADRAAEAHWLDVSRGHIRYVTYRYIPGERRVTRLAGVEYVKNPLIPHNEPGYLRVSVIATERDSALAALENELRDVRSRATRARLIAEKLGLVNECEAGLREILGSQKRSRKAG